MPQKEILNCQTFYQQIGNSSKTILLLHGWRNDWQAWSSVIPTLAQDYTVIIPDLPGFGQSDSPTKGWTTKQYTKWLIAFLQALDITELEAVIGHSYGGKLAGFAWLNAASQLPPTRQGLFLIGPSGIPNDLPLTHQLIKGSLALIPRSIKRGLLGGWRSKLYAWLDSDADYLHSTAFQEQTLQKILSEDIRRHVKKPSSLPLHLCWGENDNASPLWMAYEWLPLSHHSQVFVLPNTGHFPHQEQTSLVLTWLQTWLQETT